MFKNCVYLVCKWHIFWVLSVLTRTGTYMLWAQELLSSSLWLSLSRMLTLWISQETHKWSHWYMILSIFSRHWDLCCSFIDSIWILILVVSNFFFFAHTRTSSSSPQFKSKSALLNESFFLSQKSNLMVYKTQIPSCNQSPHRFFFFPPSSYFKFSFVGSSTRNVLETISWFSTV